MPGRWRVAVYDTRREADARIAGEVIALLASKPESLLCIAAGHSSTGLFDALIKAHAEGRISFSRARFVAMDEWAGMNAATPGSCGDFLTRNFLSRVDFAPESIRLFDGRAADLSGECKAVERFIDEAGGIDYLVLGAGNERPHRAQRTGQCALLPARAPWRWTPPRAAWVRNTLRTPVVLTGGLTLGIANLCASRHIAVTIYGARKAEVAAAAINGPITEAMPASTPRLRADALYVLDTEAASWLRRHAGD